MILQITGFIFCYIHFQGSLIFVCFSHIIILVNFPFYIACIFIPAFTVYLCHFLAIWSGMLNFPSSFPIFRPQSSRIFTSFKFLAFHLAVLLAYIAIHLTDLGFPKIISATDFEKLKCQGHVIATLYHIRCCYFPGGLCGYFASDFGIFPIFYIFFWCNRGRNFTKFTLLESTTAPLIPILMYS